jgi:rubrerythrin
MAKLFEGVEIIGFDPFEPTSLHNAIAGAVGEKAIENDGTYRCPECGERCDLDTDPISCPYCGWREDKDREEVE